MKHYGDITKINGYDLPTVDVITGGSPCQDLSVAGKRAGLAGERSGLFMEQIRIVKEMRTHDMGLGRTGRFVRPRWLVWENVPGAFSSGSPKGADFAAVIEEIIKVAEPNADVRVCVPDGGWTKAGCYYAEDGSWSIAWRVHDAQFWGATQFVDGRVFIPGTPQRRKRIALVADFGGLAAPEVLFERKGLSRDFEQSGEKGQKTAGDFGECADKSSEEIDTGVGGREEQEDLAFAVDCRNCTENSRVNGTLQSKERGYNMNSNNIVRVATSFGFDPGASRDVGELFIEEVSKTLSNGTCPGHHNGVVRVCGSASGVVSKGNGECFLMKETHTALSVGGGQAGQGYPCVLSVGVDVYNQEVTGEKAASITAAVGGTNTSGPKVLSFGFKPRQGAAARTLGFCTEQSPTINTDENYAVLCLNDMGGRGDIVE